MAAHPRKRFRFKALVLSLTGTGLATIRCLAEGGVQVVAAIFAKSEPVKYSRYCEVIDLTHITSEQLLLDWLLDYGEQQAEPMVLFGTSDQHVLWMAKHRERLSLYYRMFENDESTLARIVSKDGLYLSAEESGVPVIPSICEPSFEELSEWVKWNAGPYFIKPFFEGIQRCKLKKKNRIVNSVDELLAYVKENGSEALIIQRLIQGGDGYVFDTYGLCNRQGQPITLASHRRLRQQPPNTGTTSFGEIPGTQDLEFEARMFDQASCLLASLGYHGIFGIEWLLDKSTGDTYIIDFNARPFTTLGHLLSCGLNLPLLAYQEIVGNDLSTVEERPCLKHKFWVDLLLDLWSLSEKLADHTLTKKAWLMSVLKSRSSSYWSWKDPGPGLYRFWSILKLLAGRLSKKVKR